MPKQVKLAAKTRKETGRNAVKAVRARAAVPAIVYGAKQQPQNIEVDRHELAMLLAHAKGENVLVELALDGAAGSLALIQDIQHHPVRNEILHVDFQAVSATETIVAHVTIEATGEANGVKNFGGLLQQQMRSIEVSCLPQNLPSVLLVDVSHLNIGNALHVSHIALPEGVTAVSAGDLTVFLVSESASATSEATTATAEAAPTSPEVIKEKKPATEEAAPAKK